MLDLEYIMVHAPDKSVHDNKISFIMLDLECIMVHAQDNGCSHVKRKK